MKPVVLFDIDKTLFDTNKFIHLFSASFISLLQISPKKYEAVLAKYHDSLSKHTDYQPEEFIKHLINTLNLDKQPQIYQKLKNLFFCQNQFHPKPLLRHPIQPDKFENSIHAWNLF